MLKLVFSCPLRFVMATLQTTQFVQFASPLSNPSFCNNNTLGSSEPSRLIPSFNASGNQKTYKPTAAFSHSGYQIEAERNTTARAKDDDLPSLEELSRAALRPNISTEASKTGFTLQRLEQPALYKAGLQVNSTQSGSGECQGNSRDQPVILDDDANNASTGNEVEGAFGDIDTGRIERDTSPYIFATSELASAPTESIDAAGPWYDVEEGCYVDEPAPGPGPREQYGAPSAPTQGQPRTFPQFSTLLEDQTNQQDIDDITQSTSIESALQSLPQPSDNGNDGWTDDSMAELEEELGLALKEQQVKSPALGAPASPCHFSVEALQDEIQSREYPETLGSRPVGDQDLVEVVNMDDPCDKEAVDALPATQPEAPEIDEHRFRLRGVRARQLPGRQAKTTQYRVVWGKYPNRSDSWFSEDDVRMSVTWPPCELYTQNLAPQAEMDILRVRKMRSSLHKGRKTFEYQVTALGLDDPWITEDQLRISISLMLVAELKASSPHPLSEAQREVLLRHSATPISDEYHHTSRASRSSTPADLALGGKPVTRMRGHQEMYTEIGSDTHLSANTDDNHDACDTSDEDPRPAKRRKPRSASTVTPTTSRRHAPKVHVGQPGPFVALSTVTPEIDDARLQFDHECQSTFVVNSHQHASRHSRSLSESSEATPVTEHRQWPLQGFLECTRIGDDVTYNLEFKMPPVSEYIHIPIGPVALEIDHKAIAHSKTSQALLKSKKSRVP